MSILRGCFFIGLVGSIVVSGLGPAAAQTQYPSKPVRLLVGFPAGGALDVVARTVAQAMEKGPVHPIFVENKVGASGTIAAAEIARSSPDGLSLLLGTTANLVISRWLYPKLSYDPDSDLSPVGQFAVGQSVIYASVSSGFATLKDAVVAIHRSPRKYSYASPGIGTTAQLLFEMVKAHDGLSVLHVPYRGSPAAVNAVASGEVNLGVDAIAPIMPLLSAGRLVALAQSGTRRFTALPQVPTLRELGYDRAVGENALSLMAPARTPGPILARLETELRKATQDAAVTARLATLGFDAAFLSGRAFRSSLDRELGYWKEAVLYSHATAD